MYTPLHLAAENNHATVVEELIKSGANIHAVNKVSCNVHTCS